MKPVTPNQSETGKREAISSPAVRSGKSYERIRSPMASRTSQRAYWRRKGWSKPNWRVSARRCSSVMAAMRPAGAPPPSPLPSPRSRARRISTGPPGSTRVRAKQTSVMPRKVGIASSRRRIR